MRALVIGGRGQCGTAIGRCLADDGWDVTATTSGPLPDPATGISWLQLLGDKSLAEAVVDEVDVAIHVNAFTGEDASALIDLGDRVGSVVVLSSLSVYTDRAGRALDTATDAATFPDWPVPIPEDWPVLAPDGDSYSPQKVAMETNLRERAPWPVTIIRPGAIHGRDSRHLREWYFIQRVLDRREVVVLPFDGASIFQPTATGNLAELTRLAARQPGHRTLNCGDLDPPTVAEISATVDDLMGWTTERVCIPGPAPAPTVGDHPWAVPRPVVADMRAATTELGYHQPLTYAQALAETLPWAVEACRSSDWRDVFPRLASYPDLFDYPAEDTYLVRRRP